MAVAEEEWAGRGTVPEERARDSGSAAEEWEEVEAGREVWEAEAREREARVQAEVCGIAALAGDPVVALVADPEVRVEDPEAAAALAREAEELAPAEVGEPVAVPVEVARVRAAERVRVEAEDLAVQLVGAEEAVLARVLAGARELAEAERDRAEERGLRENG